MNIDIVKNVLRHMDELMNENVLPTESLVAGETQTLMMSMLDPSDFLIIAGITIVNGITSSMGMLSMMSR